MEYLPVLSAYCTFLPFITHEPSHKPEFLSLISLLAGRLRSGGRSLSTPQGRKWEDCLAKPVLLIPRSVLWAFVPCCLPPCTGRLWHFVCFIVEGGAQPSRKTVTETSQPWDTILWALVSGTDHQPTLAHKTSLSLPPGFTGTREKHARVTRHGGPSQGATVDPTIFSRPPGHHPSAYFPLSSFQITLQSK